MRCQLQLVYSTRFCSYKLFRELSLGGTARLIPSQDNLLSPRRKDRWANALLLVKSCALITLGAQARSLSKSVTKSAMASSIGSSVVQRTRNPAEVGIGGQTRLTRLLGGIESVGQEDVSLSPSIAGGVVSARATVTELITSDFIDQPSRPWRSAQHFARRRRRALRWADRSYF